MRFSIEGNATRRAQTRSSCKKGAEPGRLERKQRRLLAAGLDRGNLREIRREIIHRKCLDVHFDETDEGAAEVRPLPAAAIHDDANAGDLSAMRLDDVDGFLHAAAAGNDVFGHDEPLVRRDLKSAAQHQDARFFLRENVPLAERAADFLSNKDATEGRGDHRIALKIAQFVRETAANFRGDLCVLQEQGALEKLPAMQPGAQNEMAIEERARLAEERKQVVAHLGNARALACPFRRPRRNASVKFAKAGAPSPAREARALPRIFVRNR